MKYDKPELSLIASASDAIEGNEKVLGNIDNITNQEGQTVSAYEADE